MCGIAGVWGPESMPPALVKAMTDTLSHRGPDDEGFLAVDVDKASVSSLIGPDSKVHGKAIESFQLNANLYLGHRRLSIIDPSPAGHQPMSDNDNSCWIVFNGEIYNYIELREELKSTYSFRTNTDTEVVLAAYKVWGKSCVDRFNGMWAFVIYDQKNRLLFGSRDRFGVKPLYYTFADNKFSFASEIKGLLALPFVERRLNSNAVFDYLTMSLEEQEIEGFFKGIYELKPANSFKLNMDNGKFEKWQYFGLEYSDQWERYDTNQAESHISKVRELLFNAVRLRLRSDVPVGSCLSGGVDSSSVVCIINELLKDEKFAQIGEHQKVFTACYRQPEIDESRWAKLVAEKTNATWHQCYPNAEELLIDLEDLVRTQDIPFGSTSIYSQFRVMKLAADNGMKVILDGQGGDELFTGYTPFYRAFFAEMLKSADFNRLWNEWKYMVNAPIGQKEVSFSLLKLAMLKILPVSLKRALKKMYRKENSYISQEFWSQEQPRLDRMDQRGYTSLNSMLHSLMTGVNLKVLLKYEDRNSMRFSIESRTPFADDLPLIEALFKMPSSYKINNGWSKFLLRESMMGILPDEIRTRRDKVGFATPEYFWLNSIGNDLCDYLTDDLEDLYNVKRLRSDWTTLLKKQSQIGISNIWKFINLAVWLKVYRVNV